MSMDELGNIYISNGEGVLAFDRNGNNILKIPTGELVRSDRPCDPAAIPARPSHSGR